MMSTKDRSGPNLLQGLWHCKNGSLEGVCLNTAEVNKPRTRAGRDRDVAEMLMVGQIDHLPFVRHVAQESEGLFRANVVEGLHDIVRNERHGRA